jgi:membrane protease YdiL (CAAX protease family)
MNAARSDLGKATAFYLSAVGLSTLVSVLVTAFDKPHAIGFVMFTPLAAVLLTLLVFTRDGYRKAGWQSLGLNRAGWGQWPLAIWLPLVLLASSYAISTLVGVAYWHWPAGTGVAGFAADTLANLVIGTLFALGEELGWRGYLLPRLLGLGRGRAMLLSGFLHGVWHLPMILLTTTYHSDGNRLVVVPLFLATLTAAGVFFGYLRLRSNSVWPAAVAHGAFNTIWSALATLTVPTSALWMEYLSGESGVITLVLAIVAVTFLYCNGKAVLLKKPAQIPRSGIST